MCLYYRCDMCKSEQPIDAIEQAVSNRNPLGLRAPLTVPYYIKHETDVDTSDYKHICLECDNRFTAVMSDEKERYEHRLTKGMTHVFNDILVENKQ